MCHCGLLVMRKTQKTGKLSTDSEEPEKEVNYEEVTKFIVKASKEQLQNALLQCAKHTPSSIVQMEQNLESTELDGTLKTLLDTERAKVVEEPETNPFEATANGAAGGTEAGQDAADSAKASPGKETGEVLKCVLYSAFVCSYVYPFVF